MRGTIQEGGPESFRKGCWRSSCAVALWDGSLTSIRSRKERNTVDTWRCEQMFEFICLARFEYNIAKKTAVKLTHTHTLLVTTQMSISSSILGTFRSVTHDFRPVSNHRQPPIASEKCVFPDWLSCFCQTLLSSQRGCDTKKTTLYLLVFLWSPVFFCVHGNMNILVMYFNRKHSVRSMYVL